LPANPFDNLLHQLSLDPNQQHLEKMVAGKYLGELWRLACLDLIQKDILPEPHLPLLQQPFAISGEEIGHLYDNPCSDWSRQWYQQAGLEHYQPQQISALHDICTAVIERAMGLIAASYAGILKSTPSPDQPAVIAIDGSVFRFLPGFKSGVEQHLASLLPDNPPYLVLTPGGSSIGAAVAAALPSV
jgi:hexokinase